MVPIIRIMKNNKIMHTYGSRLAAAVVYDVFLFVVVFVLKSFFSPLFDQKFCDWNRRISGLFLCALRTSNGFNLLCASRCNTSQYLLAVSRGSISAVCEDVDWYDYDIVRASPDLKRADFHTF